MLRQQRNHGGIRYKSESAGCKGAEQGRLSAESKKGTLPSAGPFHERRENELRSLGKFTLRRQLRAQVGKRFHRAQQPPEICVLHRQFCRQRKTRATRDYHAAKMRARDIVGSCGGG